MARLLRVAGKAEPGQHLCYWSKAR